MPENIEKQLREQSLRLDSIYISVEKTRKYFLIIMWISIALVVLPLLGLIFAIPTFMSTYAELSQLNGL